MFSDAACTAELNTTEVPALKHAHKTFTEAKKATCTEKGNRAYWHCEDCGLYFADKDGVIDTEKSYDDNSSFIRNSLEHDFTKQMKIKEGTKLVAAPVTYKIIEGAAGTYTINAEAASVCIVGSLRVIRRQRRR